MALAHAYLVTDRADPRPNSRVTTTRITASRAPTTGTPRRRLDKCILGFATRSHSSDASTMSCLGTDKLQRDSRTRLVCLRPSSFPPPTILPSYLSALPSLCSQYYNIDTKFSELAAALPPPTAPALPTTQSAAAPGVKPVTLPSPAVGLAGTHNKLLGSNLPLHGSNSLLRYMLRKDMRQPL